jgi:hypothetical protein
MESAMMYVLMGGGWLVITTFGIWIAVGAPIGTNNEEDINE